MQALRHCGRSLLQSTSASTTVAIAVISRSMPAACSVVAAAGGADDRMATGNAAGAQPPHSARSYASPLHGMVYNERPHEWLLNDPLDKNVVQYVRWSYFAFEHCEACDQHLHAVQPAPARIRLSNSQISVASTALVAFLLHQMHERCLAVGEPAHLCTAQLRQGREEAPQRGHH